MGRSTTDNPADRGDAPDQPSTVEEAVPRLQASGKTPAFVQYVGTADERVITAADWSSIDVKDQKRVVWDKRRFRGDRVAISEFTPPALEYLIQFDGGFVLLDEDGKRV